MTPLASLQVAVRALRAHPMRSALTMLGVVVGVAAVIVILGVGAGAQREILAEIRSLGANLLLLEPGSVTAGGARLGRGTQASLTEDDAEALRREVGLLAAVAPSVYGRAQVVRGGLNWSTTVQGITPDFLVAREWPVARGREISRGEAEGGAKVALLGDTVAARLFGNEDALGQALRIANVPFTVIGVLARKGENTLGADQDDKVLVPLTTAKLRVLGAAQESRRAVQYIMLKVRDGARMADAEREVRALLRQRHRLGPDEEDDFSLQNLADVQAREAQASGIFKRLLAAVASVSLLVGGISIMNIMLVSVTERTREIGLRIAVGARRRDILGQFLIEAVTLSMLGGATGTAIGLLTLAAAAALGFPVLVEASAIALAFGFAAAVGVFFGFYPAQKASRLNPIEALRYE